MALAHVIVEWKDLISIQTVNGKWLYYEFKSNPKGQTVTLRVSDKDKPQPWTYQKQPDGQLHLKGRLGTAILDVHLKQQDPDEFLLNKRGFNWINEYPMNR